MTMSLVAAPDLYTKPALNALGGARWSYRTMALATTDLVTTEIIGINILPAGHRLVNAFVESDKLDTNGTTAIVFTVGILNTYFNQAAATASVPAAYSSGGQTNTGTAPARVSGQNLITTSTIAQGGGRDVLGVTTTRSTASTLEPSSGIGVDNQYDRIIAIQWTTAPGTAAAGNITVAIEIDRDQSNPDT